MPTDTPYSIADLARLTDVTPRTVRYYVAQGLLPAPGESGPGAHYGPAHLDRLQLIRRLQRQHLPLAEIRTRLSTLSDQEIRETLRAAEPKSTTGAGSALDYIRTVLGSSPTISVRSRPAMPGPAMPSATPPAAVAGELHEPAPVALMSKAFAPAAPAMPSDSVHTEASDSLAEPPPAYTAEAAEPPEPTIERSQWERLSLGPNVELHIRRPLSRYEQKRVDRLITIARQVLQEGTP